MCVLKLMGTIKLAEHAKGWGCGLGLLSGPSLPALGRGLSSRLRASPGGSGLPAHFTEGHPVSLGGEGVWHSIGKPLRDTRLPEELGFPSLQQTALFVAMLN